MIFPGLLDDDINEPGRGLQDFLKLFYHFSHIKNSYTSSAIPIYKPHILILLGLAISLGATFTGLGGGFLAVPFLIILGYQPRRAVGISFTIALA
jgi:hypothetical protein